jgi:hypothetical protein
MENLKHTGGAWTYDSNDVYSKNSGDEGNIICDRPSMYRSSEKWDANAKLIITAPLFLEAAIEFCERVEKGEIRSVKTYNKFKELINKATK